MFSLPVRLVRFVWRQITVLGVKRPASSTSAMESMSYVCTGPVCQLGHHKLILSWPPPNGYSVCASSKFDLTIANSFRDETGCKSVSPSRASLVSGAVVVGGHVLVVLCPLIVYAAALVAASLTIMTTAAAARVVLCSSFMSKTVLNMAHNTGGGPGGASHYLAALLLHHYLQLPVVEFTTGLSISKVVHHHEE